MPDSFSFFFFYWLCMWKPIVEPFFYPQWQGSGGLRVCEGTSSDEAQANQLLCNEIIQDQEICSFYRVYTLKEGVVTLDSERAIKHISDIMSARRKPSAYQCQVHAVTKQKIQTKKVVYMSINIPNKGKVSLLNPKP